jgi:hypothetical protein
MPDSSAHLTSLYEATSDPQPSSFAIFNINGWVQAFAAKQTLDLG